MAVIVLCPKCNQAVPYYRLPINECPRCQAEYPGAVRIPAERSLLGEMVQKPALLLLGQIVCGFVGAIFLLVLLFAPFNIGSYDINGQTVSGPEFLRRGGLAFAGIGGLLLAIAFGLWRRRAWARGLMMSYWPLSTLFLVPGSVSDPAMRGALVTNVSFGVVASAIAWWYLYHKENVVEYFRSLTAPD